jgi:hypothetical protein
MTVTGVKVELPMSGLNVIRSCFAAYLLLAALAFGNPASAQSACPNPPVASISLSQVPADVCIPQDFSDRSNPIQFFDDYSWRAFIAVVWPVTNGHRGQPDESKSVTDMGPRVFETFKSIWEIFHNDGSPPASWDTYDAAQFNACGAPVSFGDLVLASFSKFSDLGQAGVGTLVGPLVAQNGTYTRYSTGFNKIEFDQIADANHPLYLRKNIPMSGPFKDGALDVKSAWILMANVPHPERYYTRTALVLDPETGQCSPQTVGLVGLHIVQKTPTRPQWIWSTFEQVDNVPSSLPGTLGAFNFNDGSGGAMPKGNPYPLDPLILPTPAPFNVQRIASAPIDGSTATTNMAYRGLLNNAGSVWQFYQLVMTQWPLKPSQPSLPGIPSNTFPGANATSAFANVTMETFDQNNIRSGCMNCHNSTRLPTDFLWTLNDHAFPPNVPNFIFRDAAFRELKNLLTTTAPEEKFARAPAQ